jgi:hypothetical protein
MGRRLAGLKRARSPSQFHMLKHTTRKFAAEPRRPVLQFQLVDGLRDPAAIRAHFAPHGAVTAVELCAFEDGVGFVPAEGAAAATHAFVHFRDSDSAEVCHYMTQPFVELYGGCMVVLKVS